MNDHKRIMGIGASAVVLAQLTACGPAAGASSVGEEPAGVLLRADTDRDGRLSRADDDGRGKWTDDRGAIMLPNLDDDASRCPTKGRGGKRLTDEVLAACNDAADEVVNGADDVADLAPVEIPAVKGVSSSARATLLADGSARDKVRVFLARGGRLTALGAGGEIRADELRRGVWLAVEARDFVRDPAAWSGFGDLKPRGCGSRSSSRRRAATSGWATCSSAFRRCSPGSTCPTATRART